MFRAIFLAFLTVLALGFAPASAQPRRSPDVQPLDRVLPQVRSRYPGTFYDADGPFMDEGGNPHYRLKWMTPEGRVMWLDTDARTGRVLGVEHGSGRGGQRYNAPPRDAAPPPGYMGGPPREGLDDGFSGGNPYRGRDRWQHGPDGGDRGWGGRGNWNGGGRGNWNGGGHGNGNGNHDGHGGGHHGHGH